MEAIKERILTAKAARLQDEAKRGIPADIGEHEPIIGMHECFGTCRFCGQSKWIQSSVELTRDEVDDEVTASCNCPDAQVERKQRERIRKAENNLEVLCMGLPEELVQYLKGGISAVLHGDIRKMTAYLPGDKKVEIGMTANDYVYVKTTATKTGRLEA